MSKVELSEIVSGYKMSRVNDNFETIQNELNDKVLYRDNPSGEPNTMENDLDMNGFDILNTGHINVGGITINGQAIEPGDAVAAATLQVFEFVASEGQTDFDVSPLTPSTSNILVTINGFTPLSTDVSIIGSVVTIPARALNDEVTIRVFTRESGEANPTTADNVGYTASAVGAVSITVEKALDGVLSVLSFPGIDPTGATDSTSAINTAISAAKILGKKVYFPAGIYSFTSLPDVTVALIGEGWTSKARDPFASVNWMDATRFKGTILRCTAVSGNAIEWGDGSTSPWFYGGLMEDFLLIGPGSGTGIGMYMQDVISGTLKNVGIANFPIGMDWDFVEDCNFNSLKLWGNELGLRSNVEGNNQNKLFGPEFDYNDTHISATWGDMNSFWGTLFQASQVDGIVLVTSSSTLRFWNFYDSWFEDDAAMTGDIIRMGGDNCQSMKFEGARFVDVGDVNLIGGTENRGHVFADWQFIGTKTLTLPVGMNSVTVRNIVNGTIVDNSTGALIDHLDGSFTGTLTGVVGTVNGTIDYTLAGRMVSLDIPDIDGTSTSTSLTITGMPQNLIPQELTSWALVRIINNGVISLGMARIATTGVITVLSDVTGAGFVAAGTKGVRSTVITYNLDTP